MRSVRPKGTKASKHQSILLQTYTIFSSLGFSLTKGTTQPNHSIHSASIHNFSSGGFLWTKGKGERGQLGFVDYLWLRFRLVGTLPSPHNATTSLQYMRALLGRGFHCIFKGGKGWSAELLRPWFFLIHSILEDG